MNFNLGTFFPSYGVRGVLEVKKYLSSIYSSFQKPFVRREPEIQEHEIQEQLVQEIKNQIGDQVRSLMQDQMFATPRDDESIKREVARYARSRGLMVTSVEIVDNNILVEYFQAPV